MDPTERSIPELPVYMNYLQYQGVFDMQGLYEFVASFFHRKKFKFYESKYVHKKPGPFGYDNKHIWKAELDFDEYHRVEAEIYLHDFDTHDVEVVERDGTKRTLTKGRLRISFQMKVVTDYEGRWSENAFYANLQNYFHKHIIKRRMDSVWWDKVYYNIHLRLIHEIKAKLKMESDGFEHRHFHKVR